MATGTKHIAIIGGGTAGWLAALLLRKSLTGPSAPQISVVESPNIPTVGVGEGSTSVFRQVLLDLGIDEEEFLRETGATLKFGIKHAGWRRDGKAYFGPIDDPGALSPPPPGLPSNWLHHAQIAAGKSAADCHLFTALMRGNRSAYAVLKDKKVPLSPYHYAYHFDQARLGRFLADKAQGINHLRTEVEDLVWESETGEITALTCSSGQNVNVDFVLDCTGFRRAIIGKLGAEWVSYSDMLPLNKAMPFWLDHDPKSELAPFTLAQAMDSGWMWGIPVQERLGCGYVFSDAHTSPEDAQIEVEKKLGRNIDVRRIIDINPGRLRKSWIGNCVALGLAQSFLEPLEATSIHGTLVQTLLLLNVTGNAVGKSQNADVIAQFNSAVARQVDDFANFINLHYTGGRQDTPFWTDMTEDGISQTQRERLEHWQQVPITRNDFSTFPGNLPHVEEQLYTPVLDGLGHLSARVSKTVFKDPTHKRLARRALADMKTEFSMAARRSQKHRHFLASL